MVIGRTKKRIRDIRTINGYKARLKAARKQYKQAASCYTDTDRKSRALGVGECCIRTLEAIGKLNLEHKLIPGTLDYMIEQQKVVDETGRKGFEYRVTYCVTADEPAFTEEEIEKEVKELAEKLKIETAEMFRKAEEKEKQEDAGADT